MSLYCRKSLAIHLKEDQDKIFELTAKAMTFYETFFGYKFPFNKYDMIFCPEYN